MNAKPKEGRAFPAENIPNAAPVLGFYVWNRRQFLATALAATAIPVHAEDKLDAPNVVPITPTWLTSGQPTSTALARLGSRGIKSVIYLAPPTVVTAVKEEPALLEKQGIAYHNIPIPFGAPEPKHFEAFIAAMRRFEKQSLLVHCEVNMRASCMTFLYRVIVLKVPVETAYESVTKVWTPRFAWKPYVESMLAMNGVKFEVY